jgi:hypothetical protein
MSIPLHSQAVYTGGAAREEREMFVPTEHSTVADKEKFAKHFKRFLKKGCKGTLFYKWFYVQLSFMFRFIAHYNKAGFYYTYFSTPEQRQKFLDRILNYYPVGSPYYTYSDVEQHLQEWVRENEDSLRFSLNIQNDDRHKLKGGYGW